MLCAPIKEADRHDGAPWGVDFPCKVDRRRSPAYSQFDWQDMLVSVFSIFCCFDVCSS